jgi:hypothetical protein
LIPLPGRAITIGTPDGAEAKKPPSSPLAALQSPLKGGVSSPISVGSEIPLQTALVN